jgi:hypothetical protein
MLELYEPVCVPMRGSSGVGAASCKRAAIRRVRLDRVEAQRRWRDAREREHVFGQDNLGLAEDRIAQRDVVGFAAMEWANHATDEGLAPAQGTGAGVKAQRNPTTTVLSFGVGASNSLPRSEVRIESGP